MSDETEARPERALPPSFGPKPGHLRRAEIRRQVEAMGARLEARASALDPAGSYPFQSMARTLANVLLFPDPQTRQSAAELAGKVLLDVGERDDPAFWATDLGRAIAREIGWIHPMPTRVVARNVLHVTRQGVDQMVRRGDLEADVDGISPCVTRKSLQRAAARRWPFESDI